jgi:preprotein translocase subunit SecG
MTARGSANLLTRTTAILATLFFASAIGLTLLSEFDRGSSNILQRAIDTQGGEGPTTVLESLRALQGDDTSDLLLPEAAQAPAADAGSDLPAPEAPVTAPDETPSAPAGN